jgi:hypothetical protein
MCGYPLFKMDELIKAVRTALPISEIYYAFRTIYSSEKWD